MKKFLSVIKNVTDPEKIAKYGAQKIENFADYLDPNNEKTSQQIPFMITRQMKNDLSDLGYNQDDIKKMTPTYASNLLQNQIKKKQ
ncbi:unnamed protein product (macronuclear) [Paramecium tetraurelia]|uniref:Uncharacterized protein n=1 Tax=Paramecium tetraurelia TaxID=5888 RepID=A0EEN2_PARTE|nr:uncharacterized protein GSPATT00026095001 [Paramecium tetraurelia]CAK93773.1 unnamed protein product [Paramecium tetraurelia]|eukprot:XP_001461146.1 hypothetical protein (macronuclear) [Paramecium tetraurelia strain d4-2]